MKVFKFDTRFTDGPYKGMTVEEAYNDDHRAIINTLKFWSINYITDRTFSDDVLDEAKIRKIEHEHTITSTEIYVERDTNVGTSKSSKLKKENKSIEQILDEFDDERVNVKISDVNTDSSEDRELSNMSIITDEDIDKQNKTAEKEMEV